MDHNFVKVYFLPFGRDINIYIVMERGSEVGPSFAGFGA